MKLARTHPTKLRFARLACHVVATAVLFDCAFALGAVLRVQAKPVEGFGIIRAFAEPARACVSRGKGRNEARSRSRWRNEKLTTIELSRTAPASVPLFSIVRLNGAGDVEKAAPG